MRVQPSLTDEVAWRQGSLSASAPSRLVVPSSRYDVRHWLPRRVFLSGSPCYLNTFPACFSFLSTRNRLLLRCYFRRWRSVPIVQDRCSQRCAERSLIMVSLPSGAPASSVPLAISMSNAIGDGSLRSCACSLSVLLGPYRMGLGPVRFLAICFSTLLTTAVSLSHSQSWQFSSSSQRTEASYSPQHRSHKRSRTCVDLWVRWRTARGDLILFRVVGILLAAKASSCNVCFTGCIYVAKGTKGARLRKKGSAPRSWLRFVSQSGILMVVNKDSTQPLTATFAKQPVSNRHRMDQTSVKLYPAGVLTRTCLLPLMTAPKVARTTVVPVTWYLVSRSEQQSVDYGEKDSGVQHVGITLLMIRGMANNVSSVAEPTDGWPLLDGPSGADEALLASEASVRFVGTAFS